MSDTLDSHQNIFCAVRTPLFTQVKNAIMAKIRSGEWPHESMLPNEIDLAHMFNVSQGTVRRAVRELCEENILIRKQGKGTFVCSFNSEIQIFRKKFIYVQNDDPDDKWSTSSQCILFEKTPPSIRVIKLLGLSPKDSVIHIRRLLSVKHLESSRVEVFDELFLPEHFFPKLTKESFETHPVTSLYQFYQNVCGVTISHAQDQVKATLLNPEQASLAKVALPYPAIITQRIAFNLEGQACELRYLTTVTDTCHISINI